MKNVGSWLKIINFSNIFETEREIKLSLIKRVKVNEPRRKQCWGNSTL